MLPFFILRCSPKQGESSKVVGAAITGSAQAAFACVVAVKSPPQNNNINSIIVDDLLNSSTVNSEKL